MTTTIGNDLCESEGLQDVTKTVIIDWLMWHQHKDGIELKVTRFSSRVNEMVS